MKVRTRIAPSPTGIAHVGTAWMSLFDWALARQHNGQFVVRIEDTDRKRFVEGAEEKIYEGFKWLGIEYQEGGQLGGPHGPYHQSERLDIYQKYIQELLEKKQAYYCFCTAERLDEMRKEQQKNHQLPKYDGLCRSLSADEVSTRLGKNEKYVIRLKVPSEGKISWDDAIRGKIEFDLSTVDDQVLMKSDGFPTYHFAVVVDDHLMEITHILRGEEWISSTPKHLLLYKAFGWEVPTLIHMPLIRNADKSKLSKRKNDVSILSYREKGYLPEALINFIALLGWSHPEKKEIFSLEEFLEVMTLDRVQTTGPIFDVQKLDWMNGIYIRNLEPEELKKRLAPFLPSDFPHEQYEQIIPLIFERLVTLKDIEELSSFFYRDITLESELLLKKATQQDVAQQLEVTINALNAVTTWSTEAVEAAIRQVQETHDFKKKQFFMMLRVAVTAKQATPPLFETMIVIGRETSIQRLEAALKAVTNNLSI